VTDQNAIYEAYLAFAKDPSRFVASDCKPPCPVHILRHCGDKWYWVPAEAGPAFLRLVLKTSFTTDQAGPVYWTSSIASVVPRFDESGRAIPFAFVITLSSEVPNDNGTMLVTPKGGKPTALQIQALDILPFAKDAKGQTEKVGPLRGVPTKILYAQNLPVDVTTDSLTGVAVRFLAETFPNTRSQPTADTQKIQDTLENIRLLLNRATPVTP
jgi:hypothetical protein